MQVKINLRIFIFIVIFFITRQIQIYGLIMLFAFLHELGHLFVGLALGFKPQNLCINPMGISIKFKVNLKDYNNKLIRGNWFTFKKILIAIAGPGVNILLSILFIINNVNLWGIKNEFAIYSNIIIAIFNLIPIYPLDGGRILKYIIHIFKGLETSNKYINTISNISIVIITILSSISILYLKNIAIVFIVAYLWFLVINENRLYTQKLKIYDLLNNQELMDIKKENANF